MSTAKLLLGLFPCCLGLACLSCGCLPVIEGGRFVLASFDGTTFQEVRPDVVVSLYDSWGGRPWARVVPVDEAQTEIAYPARMYLNFGMGGAVLGLVPAYEFPGVYVLARNYWPGSVTIGYGDYAPGLPDEKRSGALMRDTSPGLVPIPPNRRGVWQVILWPQAGEYHGQFPATDPKRRVQLVRAISTAIRTDRQLPQREKDWAILQLACALRAELERRTAEAATQPAKEAWVEEGRREDAESLCEAIRIVSDLEDAPK